MPPTMLYTSWNPLLTRSWAICSMQGEEGGCKCAEAGQAWACVLMN